MTVHRQADLNSGKRGYHGYAMGIGMFWPRPWYKPLNFGSIALLVLIEAGVAQHRPNALLTNGLPTAIASIAWLLLVFWRLCRERPAVRMAILVVMATATIVLAWTTPTGAAIIPGIVTIVAAATRLDVRAAALFSVVFVTGYLLASVLAIGFQPLAIASYGLGFAFAFLASRSTLQLRDEQGRTKALLDELQANRDAQLQAAALDERARIAREIHDVLAHTLAALAVQLESARVLLEQQQVDPQALSSVEHAHRLAKAGLEETRRAVSALRGDQIPGTAQLSGLVEDFQRDTGTPATLAITGDANPLTPEAQLAIYRAAQEALTNVRKHAKPDRVAVVLRYEPHSTELVVENSGGRRPANGAADGSAATGEAHADAVASNGYGLMGMRERAELLGGSVTAQPTPQGYRVSLRLPS